MIEALLHDCIEFHGFKDPKGYGRLSRKAVSKNPILAHRYAYSIANSVTLESMKGLAVMHLCDNPSCINPNHLKLGTLQDNNADMRIKGRASKVHQPKGAHHGNSKLTDEIVLYIRKNYKRRDSQFGAHAMGRKFGVWPGVISSIALGKSWKHL